MAKPFFPPCRIWVKPSNEPTSTTQHLPNQHVCAVGCARWRAVGVVQTDWPRRRRQNLWRCSSASFQRHGHATHLVDAQPIRPPRSARLRQTDLVCSACRRLVFIQVVGCRLCHRRHHRRGLVGIDGPFQNGGARAAAIPGCISNSSAYRACSTHRVLGRQGKHPRFHMAEVAVGRGSRRVPRVLSYCCWHFAWAC